MSKYDPVIIECGYINLTNHETGEYYQFFHDDFEICAKGFKVPIDTIPNSTGEHPELFISHVTTYPLDFSTLKKKLGSFDAEPLNIVYGPDSTMGVNVKDSEGFIHLIEINFGYIINDDSTSYLYRYIDYFNSAAKAK